MQRIKRFLTGEVDLRSTRTFNKIFGRRVLFVENPIEHFDYIYKKIARGTLKRLYLISPENCKKNTKSRIESICRVADFLGIEVVPHLHIDSRFKNPKEKLDKKTIKAFNSTFIFFLDTLRFPPIRFSFGHWRFTHKNLYLKALVENAGMKLAKREPHIYDWWGD